MVFLFRDKSIINIVFLVLLSLLVHLHGFTAPITVVANNQDGWFAYLLNQYLKEGVYTAGFFIYISVVLLQSIRLNFLLAEQKMFPNSGYTVAMSYVLLTGLLPQWAAISPALIANFLLIWIYIKITRLYNHPAPKTLLFNIGLLVSLTILCYHPTAILIVVVLFALGIMRPFKLQEWFTLLMGIALPFYFLASWLYLTDELNRIGQFLPKMELTVPVQQLSNPEIAGLSVIVLVLLAGFFSWQQFNSRLVIQMRKNWAALLVMCFILTAAPFIFNNAGLNAAVLCLVPFTAFVSASFSYPKRLLFPNFLFFVLIGVIMYNNWYLVKF
ncbi:DUF6427 family protein [Sediminibacterium sp.]|uniref:DUF6427 family protein n=1 Tax=Sediminibacterium sp. TaxID=1917865 RepID=UPI002733BAA1|nr:DUF6427 family protein [Sediminibacterium sp.]MDP3393124.1 DUF6427 family protein [Sediminibacterium sp.]MDP3567726.1 DUF6427 family protein [Sediminibacterium sp.]